MLPPGSRVLRNCGTRPGLPPNDEQPRLVRTFDPPFRRLRRPGVSRNRAIAPDDSHAVVPSPSPPLPCNQFSGARPCRSGIASPVPTQRPRVPRCQEPSSRMGCAQADNVHLARHAPRGLGARSERSPLRSRGPPMPLPLKRGRSGKGSENHCRRAGTCVRLRRCADGDPRRGAMPFERA